MELGQPPEPPPQRCYPIGGVRVQLPVKPYPCQLAMMAKVGWPAPQPCFVQASKSWPSPILTSFIYLFFCIHECVCSNFDCNNELFSGDSVYRLVFQSVGLIIVMLCYVAVSLRFSYSLLYSLAKKFLIFFFMSLFSVAVIFLFLFFSSELISLTV